jgi:hypothetical protein
MSDQTPQFYTTANKRAYLYFKLELNAHYQGFDCSSL